METVKISKAAEESILSGHVWVFSNEVTERPQGLEAGDLVRISGERNRFLGTGYINPRSLIMIRLLSRKDEAIDESFFASRLDGAKTLRGSEFGDSFRLVNSEADFLPGLIVDKYEDYLAVQTLTYGMERFKETIVAALKKTYRTQAIILRNDSPYRTEEGLPLYTEVADGSIEGPVTINMGDLRFLVDPLSGHKTGFYFDQRENRKVLKDIVSGASVLDLFSYTCGFGLFAALWGARSVTCVDSSESALDMGRRNMELNGLRGIDFLRHDGFDFLKRTADDYDVIILDPPSFIKSRKKLREGEKGYIDLNKRAMRRIKDNGYLLTFSCSHHMKKSRFRDILRVAAYGYADLYLMRELSQSADHPVLLSIPETEYLKGLVLKIKKR
jgi:23S rRNA (cytosine1962-C5)-methyltransferase